MKVRLLSKGRRAGYAAHRLAEFAERCRESGLPVTPQRLAIIRALLASFEHPRADAIFARVRRRYPHISLATVHRTLETLCEMGEARKVTLLHDSARYDGNVAPHHHVVCVRCRRIRDIEVPGIERLLEGRVRLGEFTPLASWLEVQALCDDCKRMESKGRRKSRIAIAGN